jgi:hypothetical protein
MLPGGHLIARARLQQPPTHEGFEHAAAVRAASPRSATACIYRRQSLHAAMWDRRFRQDVSTLSLLSVSLRRVRSAGKTASAQRPLSRQSGRSHGHKVAGKLE